MAQEADQKKYKEPKQLEDIFEAYKTYTKSDQGLNTT